MIEIYGLALDEHHPVVCFDESPLQLLREVRAPMPATPGRPRRVDSGYERCGVAEVMVICQPAAGLRKCRVMAHRQKTDFAAVCQELDRMFPAAHKITLVCDNLNTHTKGALYTTFPSEEARRLASKIEIRHTPKHGSWRNIAELEFAVLGRTVFKKRIADKDQLQRELDAICARRNSQAKPVQWQFNLTKARKKWLGFIRIYRRINHVHYLLVQRRLDQVGQCGYQDGRRDVHINGFHLCSARAY